jgi:hypothetical protein
MPSKKSTRAVKAVPVKTPLHLTGEFALKGTLVVAACVVAGVMLAAARQQSQPLLTTTPRLDAVPLPAAPAKSVVALNVRPAAAVPASSPQAKTATATITGCLERDGDSFRLKDASGQDTPKARSWKSGFLKKGPAAIEVVDATHTLKLSDQVGRRVSVTGALAGREMTARSLRRVAASCDAR